MAELSIFTKIIRGEIPCYKIYEDDKTFAFLDIHPLSEGHTLVVPKNQVEFVWDLSDEDYLTLMATVKKVALHLREVVGKPYVGEVVVGVDVPHAHVHLVPFNDAREVHGAFAGRDEVEGDSDDLTKLAERLLFT